MANEYTVSAEEVLKQENFRKELIRILRHKDINVDDDQQLNDELLNRINNLVTDSYYEDIIQGDKLFDLINENFTKIRAYTFYYNSNLRRLWLPNVHTIGSSAFLGTTFRDVAYFPSLLDLSSSVFNNNVTYVIVPNAISKSGYCFCGGLNTSCTSVKIYIAPKAVVSNGNFYGSSATILELLDCYKDNFANISSPVLHTIIIRDPTAINALTNNTYLTKSLEKIKVYVHQSFIEGYKTATNWSTLYNTGKVEFLPLEGSKYESEDWYKEETWFKNYLDDLGVTE